MNSASAANAICALASLYRSPDNALSFDALCQVVWQQSDRSPIDEQALAQVFVVRPELIDAWIDFSEDQRSRDGWYIRCEPGCEGDSHCVVGNLLGVRLGFADRATACAAFVARAVGEPYVERTHHFGRE
jgi:hypothetical protein